MLFPMKQENALLTKPMDLAPTPHSCIEKSLCRTVSFYGELPQVYRHYNLVPNLIVLLEQHQVTAGGTLAKNSPSITL